MRAIFGGVLQHAPNPVPEGQDVEVYFNANYEKLGPSPAYPWFQSRMCVTALDEAPAPTFAQAIAETKPGGEIETGQSLRLSPFVPQRLCDSNMGSMYF